MPSNYSALPKFTNTIHIRDFVVDLGPDRTRPGAPNSVEIQVEVNVFPEDNFYDSTVTVEPIDTCIRAYLTPLNRELYISNAFFYAAGTFSTVMMPDNKLKIMVRALSIERCELLYQSVFIEYFYLTLSLRHPGDVSNADEYQSHLPEQWCPMITVMGFVGCRNAEPADAFSLRHFELQTSVYDPFNPKSAEFSIFCFFSHGKRWENVAVPSTGSCVSVAAKLVGRVTTENCLAVRILDMSYVPLSSFSPATLPSPAQSTPSKGANRWANRVASVTPSKKMRLSVSEDDTVIRSTEQSTFNINSTPQISESELGQQLTATMGQEAKDASSEHHSRSLTPVDSVSDSLSARLITVKPDGRPQRNRHMSKKLQEAFTSVSNK